MVADQLRARGIADERVLAAMASVPREAFLDPAAREGAYRDAALPIGQGQTMSQPWIVARMTELLQVVAGDRVLEIGTGSGYQAAILAAIGARVWTIERHRGLADTARERLAAQGFSRSTSRSATGARAPRTGLRGTGSSCRPRRRSSRRRFPGSS